MGERMSGGSFNYAYSRVQDFEQDLRCKIEANETPDEYGHSPNLSPAVIAKLIDIADRSRKLAAEMHATEWLYSSDIGEDTFLRRIA